MNVVDSSAWLEYFSDGPNANYFSLAIEDVEKLLVPTICILEVFKRVLFLQGESKALQIAAMMYQGREIVLDGTLAMQAAKLGAALKLPLADSIILATARAHSALLWTQDADFENLDGVKFKAKQQSA